MSYTIDQTKEKISPELWVAKPNREPIGRLFEAESHAKLDVFYGKVNELSFTLPYQIENSSYELIDNPNIKKTKARYLIKMILGHKIEWFIINEFSDDMNEESDSKPIHAYSLAHELNDKLIRNYSVESYSPTQVLEDILKSSVWEIGDIDILFQDRKRSFEETEITALDMVFKVAESFGAIVEFDTDRRLIHLRNEKNANKFNGLKLSYGKLLKTLDMTTQVDEIVTRLYVYGKDGLSINRINPSGTDYIESFDHFLHPYEGLDTWNDIKDKKWSEL